MQQRSKFILGGVVLLLSAVAAVPWLIPTSAWIEPLEMEASVRLDAPVRIGGIRVAGDIKVTGVELATLAQSLKLKSALTGKLDAAGPFRSQAAKPAGLARSRPSALPLT